MDTQLEAIERDGYAIFPNFMAEETMARLRQHMDALLPPIAPPEATDVGRINTLRHPISGTIMGEILVNPRLLELARALLYSNDLRMLEQVLIRTDPRDISQGPATAQGWHLDMAFLPEHYNARPRQTYFHMVQTLNDVAKGGGGTAIIPGSHHKTYAAAAKLGLEGLPQLKANPIEVAGLDMNEAVTLQPRKGDLLVFNPMCLHSGSPNISSRPRYVYFASFMDASAKFLQDFLAKTNYQRAVTDDMRSSIPAELQSLFAD